MRNVVFALLVAGAVLSFAAGQASVDSKLQGQLKQVFPGASGFSPKGEVRRTSRLLAIRGRRTSQASYSGRRNWSHSSGGTMGRSRCW